MTAIIMAGASVIAYIVGEGLVDAAREEGIEYIEEENEENSKSLFFCSYFKHFMYMDATSD